jgi:predicted regulator of Ras-like GTPase activity (Roadblock/LC7/MglB family)
MTDRDMQRWSREVAEDPGAPSFVRLARAYRRQGRRSSARDMVVRGLARNPEHLDGHALLALMHVEEGDPVRARDEWETVLRLEPGHFDASRGLGFLALERQDYDVARRHLEAAIRGRPGDPTVAQALQVLDRKTTTVAPPVDPEPYAGVSEGGAVEASAGIATDAPTEPAQATGASEGLFHTLEAEPCFAGALVLNAHGMVLAGALAREAEDSGALLGALLGGVVAEAKRTTDLLELGAWEELVVECENATIHVAPLDDGAVVVSKLQPRTPAGWVVRLAATSRSLARHFMDAAP